MIRRSWRLSDKDWLAGVLIGVATTLVLMLLTTSYHAYAVRAAVDARRTPVSQARADEATRFFYAPDGATLDDQSFSVVRLRPARGDVVTVPGVARPLRVGEVAASPAVIGSAPIRRLGPDPLPIGPDGLGAADERLAYVVTGADAASRWFPASGFGVPSSGPWNVGIASGVFGESIRIHPLVQFWVLTILLAGLPAVGLALSSQRRREPARAHRDARLAALGAPPTERRIVRVAGLIPGITVGVLAVGCTAFAVTHLGWTVPFVGFELWGRDLPWPAAAGVIGASFVVAVVVAGVPQRQRRRGAWLRPLAAGSAAWPVLVGPIAFLAALRVPAMLAPGGGWLFSVLIWLFAGVATIAVAISTAAFVGLVGRILAWFGLRYGRAAPIIAGGWTRAFASRLLVVSVATAAMAATAFQARAWAYASSDPYYSARSLQEQVADRVLVLPEAPATDLERIDDLPSDVGFLIVTGPMEGRRVSGSCPALTAVGLACAGRTTVAGMPAPWRDAWGAMAAGGSIRVSASAPERIPRGATALFVSISGRPLPVEAVQALVDDTLGKQTVERVAESWASGVGDLERQARWILVLALLGWILGWGALLTSLVGAARSLAYTAAPASALWGRGPTVGIAALTTGILTAVSGASASITGWLLVQPLLVGRGLPDVAAPLAAIGLVATAAATGAVVAVSVILQGRAARSWVPGERPDSPL